MLSLYILSFVLLCNNHQTKDRAGARDALRRRAHRIGSSSPVQPPVGWRNKRCIIAALAPGCRHRSEAAAAVAETVELPHCDGQGEGVNLGVYMCAYVFMCPLISFVVVTLCVENALNHSFILIISGFVT